MRMLARWGSWWTYLEEFTEVDEVELVLVGEAELIRCTSDMLEQVLDVLIILAIL